MNDNYIMKDGKLAVLHFLNTVIFINDDKENVLICSSNDSRNNVVLTKKDILDLCEFKYRKSSKGYNEINVGNLIIDISSDWLLFMNKNSLICVYSEMFEKVVEYIKSIKVKGEN